MRLPRVHRLTLVILAVVVVLYVMHIRGRAISPPPVDDSAGGM
jgi:hypothetical protein